LFLRKAATWHRVGRLGYHSDISDLDRAASNLLKTRQLPVFQDQESPDQWGDPPEAVLRSEFTFADASENFIDTMEEAVSLLSLDELKTLAKEAKVKGKNKGEITKALCRMSSQQAGLLSFGLRRESTNGSIENRGTPQGSRSGTPTVPTLKHEDSNRNTHFLNKILATTGPLIRLSEPIFKLFERVHLVFYRSTLWTEKSLTTIILAKISRRNFPSYIVCRSPIFGGRHDLVEFEQSMRAERAVDDVLEFNGPPGKAGFERVLEIFESIAQRWRQALAEEQTKEDSVYQFGEGAYLRRFTAAHAYTRIAHKAAHVLGRLHEHHKEHELLCELLAQKLFHPARRGSWYARKALLEEHYMWKDKDDDGDDGSDASTKKKTTAKSKAKTKKLSAELEKRKKHWTRIAADTCEAALQDPDTHLIYHYDLQKRLVKLEQRLRIPKRQQHDFGHVRLRAPEEHTVSGIQLVRQETGALKPGTAGGPSTKTIWLDELGDDAEAEVSVEEMCLSHYRSQGWKGYHSEGGILRTLFAYLFYDVLFLFVPNVFQTAFQTCPLDLHSDAFYPARASEINHRLVEIENGGAERIVRAVDAAERERRTCVVGLNWDFELEDIVELVSCFEGAALAAVCKVMAQEYRARGGGVPDLVLWRPATGGEGEGKEEGKRKGEVMFAEVKSANDRLSDTQRLWIHVLTGAGVRVALCNAVANEVRTLE
jgi:Fanconi-associated nuclease 1